MKVIAIGPRGGKIIGYKGGQPIYLKEEEQGSSGKVQAPAVLEEDGLIQPFSSPGVAPDMGYGFPEDDPVFESNPTPVKIGFGEKGMSWSARMEYWYGRGWNKETYLEFLINAYGDFNNLTFDSVEYDADNPDNNIINTGNPAQPQIRLEEGQRWNTNLYEGKFGLVGKDGELISEPPLHAKYVKPPQKKSKYFYKFDKLSTDAGQGAFNVIDKTKASSLMGVDLTFSSGYDKVTEFDADNDNLVTTRIPVNEFTDERLMFVSGKDNTETALIGVGRSLIDILSQTLASRPQEGSVLLGDKDKKTLETLIHLPKAKGANAKALNGDDSAAQVIKINEFLESLGGSPAERASMIASIIEERMMHRAIGTDLSRSKSFFFDHGATDTSSLTLGPAFQNDLFSSEVKDLASMNTTTDPVLTALFEYIQKADSQLGAAIQARFATLAAKYAQSAGALVSATAAMREAVKSVATPLSRVMVDFGANSSSALIKTASLHSDILDFAKMSLQGVVQEVSLEPQLKPGDEAQPGPAATVPESEAPAETPEAKPNAPAADWSQFSKDMLKDATEAQPLRDSTAGGFVVTTGDHRVVVKNSKAASTEASANFLMNGLVGDEHCPPAIVFKGAPEIKGADTSILSSGIITPFIPNKGSIPKIGSQIEAVLNEDQKAQLVGLGIASWVLGDADAHGGNYIITENGNLARVDLGQANFIYEHIDKEASYNVSPNSNEIALNALLRYYAGDHAAEAPKTEINFNHPFILDTLQKIETHDFAGSPLGAKAKSRAKKARADFEKMIRAVEDARTNSKGSKFKFGQGTGTLAAWSPAGKTQIEAHHFQKPFQVGDILSGLPGAQGAKVVRNKFDGAKYIYKRFPPNKKLSAMGEVIGSSIAAELLPMSVDGSGSPVQHTAQAFLIPGTGDGNPEVVQRRLFNAGMVGDKNSNVNNWQPHQLNQLNAVAMVRYLLGDHDGHSKQYMWTDPPSGVDPSIIGIDWGNAWKHASKSSDAVDIKSGYYDFSPQTSKLDKQMYDAYIAGKVEIDFADPMVQHIAQTCSERSEEFVARMEPYLAALEEKFGKGAADKVRKKTLDKMQNFTASYEAWATHLQSERAKKAGEAVPAPFKLAGEPVQKSLGITVFKQRDCLYKAIKVISRDVVFVDQETEELSDLALELLQRFATVVVNTYGQEVVSDTMLRRQPNLRQQAFLLNELEEHITTILQDPYSRRAYL